MSMSNDPTPAEAMAALQAGGKKKKTKREITFNQADEWLQEVEKKTDLPRHSGEGIPRMPMSGEDSRSRYGQSGGSGYGGRPGQFEDWQPRTAPTAPPFTLFIGGLTMETTEADILHHFSKYNVISARLVSKLGAGRQTAYADFGSADLLTAALLEMDGHSIRGVRPKLDYATPAPSRSMDREPRRDGFGSGFGGSEPRYEETPPILEADISDNWRRGARAPQQPVRTQAPPREGNGRPPRSGFFGSASQSSDVDAKMEGQWRKVPARTPEQASSVPAITTTKAPSAKMNPFGDARPREVVLQEKQATQENAPASGN